MATSEQYAQWIVDNADKRGTPEFNTVAEAYKASKERSSVSEPVVSPQEAAPVEKTERTFGGTLKDIGISALSGAIGLPQSVVGLLDIPTGGAIGKGLESLGYRPEEAKKFLKEEYSPAQKEAFKQVSEAKGFIPTLQAAVRNPSTILQSATESIPQMLGGMGIARGVMAAAPKLSAAVAGGLGEGILGAGSAAEQIREESPDKLLAPLQSLAALGSGAGTAAFGILGGKIAGSKLGQRIGLNDVDTMLARGGAGAAEAGAAKAGFIRSVIGSGISEGVLEELPQSMQEKMWQNWATNKPLMEGVSEAGAMGLITGAAVGAVGGGYGNLTKTYPAQPPPPPPEAPQIDPDKYSAVIKGLTAAIPDSGLTDSSKLGEIFKASGIENEAEVSAYLNQAITSGEIVANSNPVFNVTDANGKVLFNTVEKAVADKAAERLNAEDAGTATVAEATATKFTKPTGMPQGIEVRAGQFKQDMFNISRGDTVLNPEPLSAEEVGQKAYRLSKITAGSTEANTKEIEVLQKKIDTNNTSKEKLEAAGEALSPEYATLSAQVNENNALIQAQIDEVKQKGSAFSGDISITPAKESEEGFTLFKQGKPAEYFKTEEDLNQALAAEPTAGTASPKPEALDAAREALREKLLPFLKQVGLENTGLRIMDSIENGQGESDGRYTKQLIDISLKAANPMGTLRHETIHALKELGAFSKQEWSLLESYAKKQWINQFLRQRKIGDSNYYDTYKKIYLEDNPSIAGFDEYIIEEAIADAFKYFNATKPPANIIGNIYRKVKAFLEGLGNQLSGLGFQTADDVFKRVESGGMKPTQQAGTGAAPRYSYVYKGPKDIPQNIWNLHQAARLAEDIASGRKYHPSQIGGGRPIDPGQLKRNQTMSFRRFFNAVKAYLPNDEEAQLKLMRDLNVESRRREEEAGTGAAPRYSVTSLESKRKDIFTDPDTLEAWRVIGRNGLAQPVAERFSTKSKDEAEREVYKKYLTKKDILEAARIQGNVKPNQTTEEGSVGNQYIQNLLYERSNDRWLDEIKELKKSGKTELERAQEEFGETVEDKRTDAQKSRDAMSYNRERVEFLKKTPEELEQMASDYAGSAAYSDQAESYQEAQAEGVTLSDADLEKIGDTSYKNAYGKELTRLQKRQEKLLSERAAPRYAIRNTTKGLLNPNIPLKNIKIINDVASTMELTPEEFASTSLIYQTGRAGGEQFDSEKIGGLPAVVQFLQDERRMSGLPLLDIEKPEDRKILAKLMAAEALAAIRSGGANLEWYDSIVNKMLAMAGLKYSELNTDINSRVAFKIATAVTSQGLNVEDNLAFAMKVYDQFRVNGRFPEIGLGKDQESMVKNFQLANFLLRDMNPNLMRQFLETEFTVEEMRGAGFNIAGELGDEKVLGSSVFGPKIGFGFYSNLNGNFDPVTMDMWFMRTIGRLTGKLKTFRQDLYDAQLKKFRNELDTEGGNGVFANQFDQNDVELAKVNDKAAEALVRKVKTAHERDYKVNRAFFDNGTREKSKLVAASETIVKSLDTPKDAPANGLERRNLRDVVRQMVNIVEEKYGKRVPPASLQAAIWYPEQELYKAMGVKLRVTSQSYAGAIEKILTGEGYGKPNLESAAKLGSRTAQQLAKSTVSTGIKKTGEEPIRLGPLQAGEKEALLYRGRRRVVLEEERVIPKRKRVMLEVAPDPNNKMLVKKWRSLSNEQRINISDKIANEIVKDTLTHFGLRGYVDTQVGSYLDDTNPSFALYLDSGDSVAVAKFLGHALSQDAMTVISPKASKGLDKTGAVRLNIGDVSASEVGNIYQQLREIKVNGKSPIGGQSYVNGYMVVLNYSDVPTDQLAKLIDSKLGGDYEVITEDVYTAFPEKRDYNYDNPSSDPRGNSGILRQASRDLRAKATKLLEKELKLQTGKTSRHSLQDTVYIDGVNRPTTNSSGRPIFGTLEGIKNFWRGFDESKIVDKEGRPLLMYHGTTPPEDGEGIFSQFRSSDDGKMGKGIYTTSIEKYAESFAPSGAVMPLYISMNNPFYINLTSKVIEGKSARTLLREQISGESKDTFDKNYFRLDSAGSKEINNALNNEIQSITDGKRIMDMSGISIQRALKKAGYDGIVVKDSEGNFVEVNAFDSEQIKSATGNRGTFSPKSKDIRYSLREKADELKAMSESKRDALEMGDFDYDAYTLYEAEKLMPPKDGAFKKLNGNNSFVVHNEADAVVNVDGNPFLATEVEDPDNEDEIIWHFSDPKESSLAKGITTDFSDKVDAVSQLKQKLKESEGKPVKYSLRDDFITKFGQADLTNLNSKTHVREEVGFAKRLAAAISPDSRVKLRAQIVNRLEAIERQTMKVSVDPRYGGSNELLADVSATAAALQSQRASGIAAESFKRGVPVYANGFTSVSDLNGTVDGLIPIFQPLLNKYKDPMVWQLFQFYSATRRGGRFIQEGREKLFTAADIQKGKDYGIAYPEFDSVFKEYQKYNEGLVKFQVDTGVLTPEMGRKWMMYSDYVPFYRQINGEETIGPKLFQNFSGVKPTPIAKGSDVKIADFLETIILNARSAIENGMKNVAAQRIARDAMRTNSPKMQDMARKLEYWEKDAADVIHVRENGVDVRYKVADILLVEAMKGLGTTEMGTVLKFMAYPTKVLRDLVTKDPGFMLANLFRDSAQAYVTSGTNMIPIIDTFKQAAKILANQSPEAKALMAAGIGGGYEFSGDVKASAKAVSAALNEKAGIKTGWQKALWPVSKVWSALEAGTTASDLATRSEIYARVMKSTNGNEAEAVYQALEVMNFGRMGSSPIIQVVSALVPFFNARVQGLDVLYRAGTGRLASASAKTQQKLFARRAMYIMGISIAYWMLARDTDEWKRASKETRDNNWIVGSVKVPIPFEIGTIFKVLPERILEYTFGNDTGADLADSAKRNILSTLKMNPIPQAMLPLVEAYWIDYSFFTGNGVVGRGMEKLDPQFQLREGTSLVAKKMGDITGMSPVKIDHVLQGYTGAMGMYVASAISAMIRTEDDGAKASMSLEQTPILKRFFASDKAGGSIDAFYEFKKQVDMVVATQDELQKRGNPEQYIEYMKTNGKLLGAKQIVSNIGDKLSEMRKLRNIVNFSKSMPPDQKRETLDNIRMAEIKLTESIKGIRAMVTQ
jgi:hypothetical protein